MARPIKRGLDYFPVDTGMLGDRKIQKLLHMYGCEGITVYLVMLCDIYASNGYFISANDELFFDIGFILKLDEKRVREIINYCVKIRLFDINMLKTNNIYTSTGIQDRFREICKRSRRVMDPAFTIDASPGINVTETPVIDTEIPVMVTETPVNVTKTPAKGKGNIKGKKEKTVTKKKDETKIAFGQGKRQPSGSDEEAARRAELLRMAEAATSGC